MMDYASHNSPWCSRRTIPFWVMTGVTFFIAFFLLGYSFDTLGPHEMAFMYNQNTHKLDNTKVYNAERGNSGRWFTGLGVGFYYKFPKQVQRITMGSDIRNADEDHIICKTIEGVDVQISVGVQYRLKTDPDSLYKLFQLYGYEYQWRTFYIVHTRSIVRDVISQHNVQDLWEKRAELAEQMADKIKDMLNSYYSEFTGFQLFSVFIPDQLQNAIEGTTVVFQNIQEAREDLKATQVSAETRRLQAEQSAFISVVSANASAQEIMLQGEAQALALNTTVVAEANGWNSVKQILGFNNSHLLAYAWLDALLSSNAKRTILSIEKPISSETEN